jgi:hypothetical protein
LVQSVTNGADMQLLDLAINSVAAHRAHLVSLTALLFEVRRALYQLVCSQVGPSNWG